MTNIEKYLFKKQIYLGLVLIVTVGIWIKKNLYTVEKQDEKNDIEIIDTLYTDNCTQTQIYIKNNSAQTDIILIDNSTETDNDPMNIWELFPENNGNAIFILTDNDSMQIRHINSHKIREIQKRRILPLIPIL